MKTMYVAVELANDLVTAKAIEKKFNFNLHEENKIKLTPIDVSDGLTLNESEIHDLAIKFDKEGCDMYQGVIRGAYATQQLLLAKHTALMQEREERIKEL